MLVTKLAAIADAIRGKTGKSDGLTLDQMATEIANIEAGGGVGMESGEIALADHYNITIPVSSKKTHVVLMAKNLGALISNPTDSGAVARRISFVFGAEGVCLMETSVKTGYNSNTGMASGDCYLYDTTEAAQGYARFNENSIVLRIQYSPMNLLEYYWFAW